MAAATGTLTGTERKQKLVRAAQMYKSGMKWKSIYSELGIVRGQRGFARDVHKHIAKREYRDEFAGEFAGESAQAVAGEGEWVQAPDFVGADSRRDALRQYLRTTWTPTRVQVSAPSKTRRVVACGDWRGNIDAGMLAALVNARADTYIIGGDTYDQHYASSWGPDTAQSANEEAEQGFRQESANNRAALEMLHDNTDAQIKILLGNHDIRAWRAAYRALPRFIRHHWKSPFDMLLEGMGERVQMVGHAVKHHFSNGTTQETGHNDEFIYVYGDALHSHMNFVGGQTETGVSKIWRHWFAEWRLPLGIDYVRMIVHFHVHARNMHSKAGGHVLLVEPGMCGNIKTEAYKAGYNAKWRPGVQGFTRYVQYHDADSGRWRTDLASVELIAPSLEAAR